MEVRIAVAVGLFPPAEEDEGEGWPGVAPLTVGPFRDAAPGCEGRQEQVKEVQR
jgi:hypothetical protein